MNTTVEKNNPKIFPKNEHSKGVVAPPVPPKSHQTKFARIKAIFEQNASHFQVNDSNTVSSNLGETFGPTMRKLMEDGDINIHVSASTPSKQRCNSGDSGVSLCSDVSGRTSDNEDRVIEEKMKDTFPKLPACAYKLALFPKTIKRENKRISKQK